MKLYATDQISISSVQPDSIRPGQSFKVSDELGKELLKKLPHAVSTTAPKGKPGGLPKVAAAAAKRVQAPRTKKAKAAQVEKVKVEPAPLNKAEQAPLNKGTAGA